MTGQKLGHYRILDKIGAGGMGAVYRARDEHLHRDVAIKVLSAERFDDPVARVRLLLEARAAAALNHPHVCTIHEVGEAQGQPYIAMELIEGQRLDQVIRPGGLPLEQVMGYGAQIASALAHAHERGVEHRDLKGANVLVTPDGRAKVLDFGLARRMRSDELWDLTTQATVTQPGAVAGTLPYMAPEQLRGLAADAACDVWALGVILYEMAAGVRPFHGETAFELSGAILNRSPAPLPPHVPAALQEVIERCLQKEPGQRYRRGRDVRAALEAIQSGVIGASAAWRSQLARVRLAVLPFENLSGGPDQEYLSDGLTEEMIAQLGRLHPQRLGVIARTSAMRYKKTDKTIDRIGRELGVDYVLEGSVRREAGRVRVTAQLIHVRDQMQVWAESYDRALAGILALQSEIAGGIAKSLALTLLPVEEARLTRSRSVNPEAYEAYLKGCFHWYKLTPQDVESALGYFERARDKDPDYALAYVGLSNALAGLMAIGALSPREAWARAKPLLDKAQALDDTLPELHHVLATFTTWVDWNWADGEAEFLRALELNPNYADARNFYSLLLTSLKRWAEAKPQGETAVQLDPYNFFFQWIRGFELLVERRYDEAVAQIRTSLKLEPGFLTAHWGLWQAFHAQGMHAEALNETKAVLPLWVPAVPEAQEALMRGYAEGGYRTAMRSTAEALATRASSIYVMPTLVAELYVCAEEKERALHWLERAYEDRTITMVYLAVAPFWDILRDDLHFRQLLRRMNLPD